MIIHKQLLEICLFDNSTDTLHLHLQLHYTLKLSHIVHKKIVFSWIFQDFVVSDSTFLLIF